MSSKDLAALVAGVIRYDGEIVVATEAGSDGERNAFGLPKGHAFSVLGYDSATNLITVRNPWGTGGPRNDGYHWLTPDQFKDNFVSIAFDQQAYTGWQSGYKDR
jgi:hypothetical protein